MTHSYLSAVRVALKRTHIIAISLALVLSTISPIMFSQKAAAATLDPFPSTNAQNKASGHQYVELVSRTTSSVTINFVNPTPLNQWLEVRVDNAAPSSNPNPNPCRIGVEPLAIACDGKRYLAADDHTYPSKMVAPGSSSSQTYAANSNVAVRVTFGGERDWDFDWTTFAVAVAPNAPSNLRLVNNVGTHACGLFTNINTITPTWNAVSGAVSYNYKVTLPNGSTYGPVNVGNVTSLTGPFGAEGQSSFSVQAVNSEGFTSAWATPCNVTYDATKPVVNSNITDNSVLHGVVAVTETVTELNPLAYNIRILDASGNPVNVGGSNLGAFASPVSSSSLTYNWNTAQVADGTYKLQFSARDKANNTETIFRTIVIDNTAPSTTFTSPTFFTVKKPTITGTVNDPHATLSLEIVGKGTFPVVNNGSTWSYTSGSNLSDGHYTVNLTATDTTGNQSTVPQNITVDTKLPGKPTLLSPVNGITTTDSTPSVSWIPSFSSTHPPVTFHVEFSADNFATVSTTCTTSATGWVLSCSAANALADGTYQVRVRGVDSLGGAGQWSNPRSFIVDTTPPSIAITAPSNGQHIRRTVAIKGNTAGGIGYLLTVRNNNGNIVFIKTGGSGNFSHDWDTTSLADGNYTITIQAADNVMNSAETSITVIVDNTSPFVGINSYPNPVSSSTPTISGTTTDNYATTSVKVTVNGVTYTATPASGAWSVTTDTLTDGIYPITAVGIDAAGNETTPPATGSITIDTTKPDITITAPADGNRLNGTVQITGDVNDTNPGSYTLSIDGAPVLSGTSGVVSYTWDTRGLASDTYVITLKATDAAGNTRQKSISVIVDNTAPNVPVLLAPTNNTNGTRNTITSLTWQPVSDTSSPVSYKLEIATDAGFTNILGSITTTATSYNIAGFGDGTYHWRIQACDSLNNCSAWSNSWNFSIDNTAPIVTLNTADTTETTPTITGTVNDPRAVVTVNVSGITYAAIVSTIPNAAGTYNWSVRISRTLRVGAHSITVYARDALGNSSVQTGAINVIMAIGGGSNAITNLASAGATVLSDSSQNGNVDDGAATDNKDKKTTNPSGQFLGLGWWWLPLLVAAALVAYYARQRRITKP